MKLTLQALATAALLTLVFAFVFSCANDVEGAPGDIYANDVDDDLAAENALEIGDVDDEPGLCDRLIAQGAVGKARADVDGKSLRVFTGTNGADRIEGTGGSDVIFGLGGDDKLFGNGGNDVICAGAGRDYVEGGLGQDRIYGELDDDILHGGGAGDWVHGGGGADLVFGDILDDKLYGDDGADVLIGGHGTDLMDGGDGNDWLRGDTNGDIFLGGAGDDDVASFMTARPSGRASRPAASTWGAGDGVVMDVLLDDSGRGRAIGDGADEEMRSIERVIGSAFHDRLRTTAAVDVPGLEEKPERLPAVFVDARPRDTGVIVLGSRGADAFRLERRAGGVVVVTETSGEAIHASGADCAQTSTNVVRCSPRDPLRYVLAWGDDGSDRIVLADDDVSAWPRDFEAHLDGGDGDDEIIGSDGPDVIFGGRDGADVLDGRGGDDALISESYAGDRMRNGHDYEGGADTLLGRAGNDQLVSDYPCGGHYYSGGRGVDIAGFARVGPRSIHAQLRGPVDESPSSGSVEKSAFFGKSFLPGVCNVDVFGTHLEADLEILEGSKGDDKLLGNNRRNVIWGRQGNDVVRGFGGPDVVYGHEGNDDVAGGAGDDVEAD